MSNEKLTIFTPVYNRAHLVERLYQSLANQCCNDFEWLIIDDGSSDNICEVVGGLIKKAPFRINFIQKENGGKHTAYNMAITHMNYKGYHICVDSDDYLSENAVSHLRNQIVSIAKKRDIIGVVSSKVMSGIQGDFTKLERTHIPDIKYRYSMSIETAILIENEILAGFKFPVFPEERFLGEEIMYIWLAQYGFFRVDSKQYYYAEYLNDGLTNNIFNLWLKNSQGTEYSLVKRYNYISENLKGIKKFKELSKCAANLLAIRFKSCHKNLFESIDTVLVPVAVPLAVMLLITRFSER